MASCNSTDILATAYRNGYAKLSSRDLMVAAIASACSTCNAQPLIEAATGLGYLKLSEFDTAMCIAESLCSSPGVTAAPAPTILKLAMQDHLAAMSRRDLDGVIAALLCKMTNPPCVTPATPGTPAAFSTLNNILKISWAQPPNSGSLILNYTVSYGTTQGGPYTSTVTVPAMTKQAILNGLSSGTTYYFVVKANSFTSCSSANSSEGSASTGGSPPVDPVTTDWVNRVIANGGANPSAATVTAVNNFVTGMKADGLDTLMVWATFFAPDSLIAALTPIYKVSGFDPATNVGGNFVGGDLSVNGLTGNGIAKVIDTGVDCSVAFTPTNVGWSVYGSTVNNTGYDEGFITVATIVLGGMNHGGNSRSFIGNGSLANAVTVATKGAGFYTGNRITSTDHRMFFANSTNAFAQIGATDVTLWNSAYGNTHVAGFADRNSIAGLENFSNNTISWMAMHQGLTSAQGSALFNRVQTLRQAFGGGFV